ncbi:hypothetical protein TNCV_1305001 [Trichonephila clavipes]|nr:hypothetical protein TNCV_1305001 [Trichonephila clavipes]
MIPAYNKKRCAAFSFVTGIHFRRKTDFLPEEDTTMSYSGFEPELTRLQADGHSRHTGWGRKNVVLAFPESLGMARLSDVLVTIKCLQGIFDDKDAPRTNRSIVKNVDKITEIIEVDQDVSSRSIAQELHIDHKAVLNHLLKAGL